mmetsp:Transcript_989/g.2722  ORF Transcript_989/g.2722 Transcript_989/m.2722 type:complete len:349 (-) Transcript_989:1266-2312(-)
MRGRRSGVLPALERLNLGLQVAQVLDRLPCVVLGRPPLPLDEIAYVFRIRRRFLHVDYPLDLVNVLGLHALTLALARLGRLPILRLCRRELRGFRPHARQNGLGGRRRCAHRLGSRLRRRGCGGRFSRRRSGGQLGGGGLARAAHRAVGVTWLEQGRHRRLPRLRRGSSGWRRGRRRGRCRGRGPCMLLLLLLLLALARAACAARAALAHGGGGSSGVGLDLARAPLADTPTSARAAACCCARRRCRRRSSHTLIGERWQVACARTFARAGVRVCNGLASSTARPRENLLHRRLHDEDHLVLLGGERPPRVACSLSRGLIGTRASHLRLGCLAGVGVPKVHRLVKRRR